MPLAAVLPAIIGAAGAIGGGLLSRKAGYGGPSDEQKQLNAEQLTNIKQGREWATTLFPQGQNLLDLSKSTFQAPLDYWGRLAGGSRQAATSALAPEIQRIQQGEDAARRTSGWLLPRSGGSTSYMLDSMFAPQRAISSLMQTARPAAISSLSDLAERFARLGATLTGEAGGLLSSSTSGASSASRNLMDQERLAAEKQEALGKGIGGLLADITRSILNRGKSPTSPLQAFWDAGNQGPVR